MTAGGARKESAGASIPVDTTARRAIRLQILLVVAASLALTLPSLRFSFVWDDPYLIPNNSAVTGPFSLSGIFSSTLVLRDGPSEFFRPLQLLTHALEHRVFGNNPGGYHAVSALLHAAAALLVFLTARLFAPAGWGACLGALLFAVHPAHAETASFISARGDLLATCFALLAFLAVARASSAPSPDRLIAASASAGGAYLASLLSKESGLLLPVLLLSWPWLGGRPSGGAMPRRRVATALAVAFIAALAAYGAARAGASGEGMEVIRRELDPGGALRRIPAYLRMLVDPTALQVWWPEVPAGWSWGSLIGASLLVAIGLACTLRFRSPSTLFLWGWFFATLLPVLKLVPFSGADLAARYLYLPSVAFCWAATSLWNSNERAGRARKSTVRAAAVAGLALLAWPWYRETRSWRTELALYERMAGEAPGVAMVWYNLGNAQAAAGRKPEALGSLQQAVGLLPSYASAHYNLARYLADAGRYVEAQHHLETYLRLRPQASDRTFAEAFLLMLRQRTSRPASP